MSSDDIMPFVAELCANYTSSSEGVILSQLLIINIFMPSIFRDSGYLIVAVLICWNGAES